jgi:hypothetical protein
VNTNTKTGFFLNLPQNTKTTKNLTHEEQFDLDSKVSLFSRVVVTMATDRCGPLKTACACSHSVRGKRASTQPAHEQVPLTIVEN